MNFRKLEPGEIDLRIGSVFEGGVTLLCYKDARVDMQILDETVGPENWQREHYEVKGNLYCRVGIKCGNDWVWKSDCGVESYTEKEKGESSDSFKRACVCWGIGRELYTSPFIYLQMTKDMYEAPKKLTKKAQSAISSMKVSKIHYNDKGEIDGMEIVDKNGSPVWKYGNASKSEEKKPMAKSEATAEMKAMFQDVCKSLGQDPAVIIKKAGWSKGPVLEEHIAKANQLLKKMSDEKDRNKQAS